MFVCTEWDWREAELHPKQRWRSGFLGFNLGRKLPHIKKMLYSFYFTENYNDHRHPATWSMIREISWICWRYLSLVSPWCAAADCTTPFGISLWSKIKEYWIATSSFRAALGTWMSIWRSRKLLHWNSWAKYELTNNNSQNYLDKWTCLTLQIFSAE